ncbi:MAG: glycoside hydrolase family 140 protein [Candidatus Sumerlaeia bacterium]|nr:glycoside hydrolase family 140 protein [Candidatus Sumerlaeia bacterium]
MPGKTRMKTTQGCRAGRIPLWVLLVGMGQLLILVQTPLWAESLSPLRVSANGHYFETADGKPFFWLADSVFFLAKGKGATREFVERYFRDRKAKGFTVIRMDAIHDDNGPNAYGDRPLLEPALTPAVTPGSDFNNPEEWDYWDNLDWIISKAAEHGLYLELEVFFVGHHGDGYQWLNDSNAFALGKFLGDRYKHRAHIVWELGGDRDPKDDQEIGLWRDVARGLAIAYNNGGSPDYTRFLAGYHPLGGSASSTWFHNDPWLDYNGFQTNNQKNVHITHGMALQHYRLAPAKPIVLVEPWYEDNPRKGLAQPINLRREAYHCYLGGGHFVFGNARLKVCGDQAADYLHTIGAREVSVTGQILRSLPWWTLVPDTEIIREGAGEGHTATVAALASDRRMLVAYFAENRPAKIDMEKMKAPVAATWIKPADGAKQPAGQFANSGQQTFAPPSAWEDAVLVLEAAQSK